MGGREREGERGRDTDDGQRAIERDDRQSEERERKRKRKRKRRWTRSDGKRRETIRR